MARVFDRGSSLAAPPFTPADRRRLTERNYVDSLELMRQLGLMLARK